MRRTHALSSTGLAALSWIVGNLCESKTFVEVHCDVAEAMLCLFVAIGMAMMANPSFTMD